MSTDWLTGSRAVILAMCRNWLAYMTEARRTLWGVPNAEFVILGTLYDTADALLKKDETERTHVITVELQAAFKALTAKMRFFKDRYFKMPPLSEGDWARWASRQKRLTPQSA